MSTEATRPASCDALSSSSPIDSDESAKERTEGAGERDRELLRRMRDDDERALEEIMRENEAVLQRRVCAVTGTPESAEEIVQDAFVRLWEGRARWRPTSSIKAILHRVARNLALNYCRDRDRRRKIVEECVPRPPAPAMADELMEAEELVNAIDECLAELPERRANIVKLTCLEGRPPAEVARLLGLSSQTVWNQASVGRRQLADKLRRRSECPIAFRT